jgi:uncharacterized protein
MKHLLRGSLLVLTFWLALCVQAQIPQRPVPPRLVNDFAGLLNPAESHYLERSLVAFDDSTSNQICLVIVNDLQGMDVLDLAFKIGEQWQVGQKGFDNGLVLLIKTKTDTRGEVAIATGYGLEAVLTDAVCKRIIEEEILPQFRQDRYFEGIQAGLDRIKLIASGEYSYSSSEGDGAAGFAFFVLFIVFIIVFLALVSKKHKGKNGGSDGNKGKGGLSDLSKAIILSGMLGGRNRGGSWGGGSSSGGFGGFGGGRFGGGGAKGGW